MLKKETKESYVMTLASNVVKISADNYFGARHAVETLFQVIFNAPFPSSFSLFSYFSAVKYK